MQVTMDEYLTMAGLSTNGKDESLSIFGLGCRAILIHQKIVLRYGRVVHPPLHSVVWVLVTVKDSVGVSHGVMHYLHTHSSPTS